MERDRKPEKVLHERRETHGGLSTPFTITNRMVGLVSEIAEKIGRLDRNKSLDMKPHLRHNNRIRSITRPCH